MKQHRLILGCRVNQPNTKRKEVKKCRNFKLASSWMSAKRTASASVTNSLLDTQRLRLSATIPRATNICVVPYLLAKPTLYLLHKSKSDKCGRGGYYPAFDFRVRATHPEISRTHPSQQFYF
jgi:hypothetical protein